MSKHIGAYSSLHGPAGKVLTDYTELNIPWLWERATERIEDVANTGTNFTGVIPGWSDSPAELDLFEYNEDKFFLFTPHVPSNDEPSLSLNGLPLLPMLLAEDSSPLLAGAMLPGNDYLLLIKDEAFHLIANLTTLSRDLRTAATVETLPASIDIETRDNLTADLVITGGFDTYSDAGGNTWARGGTTEPSLPVPSFHKKQAFDGHWYEAISKRTLYAEEAGVYGEGTSVDVSGEVNEALSWLGAKGGGKFILTPGTTYAANDLLLDTSGIWFSGTGTGASGGAGNSLLNIADGKTFTVGGDSAANERFNIKFSDLAVQQPNTTTRYFFSTRKIRGLKFRDIQVKGVYGFIDAGIRTVAPHPVSTRVLFFDSIEGGLNPLNHEHFICGTNMGIFWMSNVFITGAASGTTILQESSFLTLPGNDIIRPDGCNMSNVSTSYFDRGFDNIGGSGLVLISNSWFDGCRSHGIRLRPIAGRAIAGFRMSNVHIAGVDHQLPWLDKNGVGLEISEEDGGNCGRVALASSHILHFGREAVAINGSTANISIIGNQMEDNALKTVTSVSTTSQYSAISIGYSAAPPGQTNGVVVVNNHIYRANYTARAVHGIDVQSTNPNLVVANNIITGHLEGNPAVNNPNRGPAHTRKVYNNSQQLFEGQVIMLGPWVEENVVGNTLYQMTLSAMFGAETVICQRRGKAIGIAARANGDVTAGQAIFQVMKNGVVFGMFATGGPAPPNFSYAFAEDIPGSTPSDFDAGDTIGVQLNAGTSYAPNTLTWSVFISIMYD